MTMKLERIGREVIKPASPTTPSHVRTIHLSLFDQFLPTTYLPAIFFYDKTAEEETVSKILKSSLSETLTRFYPLAGRIQGVSLDCNDEGALFTQTRVDMLLSDLLTNPDALLPEQLIPSDSMDLADDVCPRLGFCCKRVFRYSESCIHDTVFLPSCRSFCRVSISCQARNRTRVEAATSLLLNSATKASKSNLPLVMTQTMDLRPRVPPALLPGMAIGNLFFLAEIFKENPQENRTIAELGEMVIGVMLNSLCELSPEMDKYAVTSWCRFPLYEVDFGWGNPVWVAAGRMVGVQVIIMDAKDGEGIEAWVTLPEQDMLEFEHDQELLAYVTPNPSALI